MRASPMIPKWTFLRTAPHLVLALLLTAGVFAALCAQLGAQTPPAEIPGIQQLPVQESPVQEPTGVQESLSTQEDAEQPEVTQVNSVEQLRLALDRRGDLTLRDSTLEGALFTISELWEINIVAGGVQGAVNGVFRDAPLREILDSILLSNNYAYRQVGGSLVISRLQELGQVNPYFQTETISVGVAKVSEVVEAIGLLKTPQGQVRALQTANAVLVVDFPDRIEKMRDLVRQIDAATRNHGAPAKQQREQESMHPKKAQPALAPPPAAPQLEVAYFRTHFIEANKASQALTTVLSPKGRITAMDGEDRLLVLDYAQNIELVQAVLERLDRPRPQVNIMAMIYDISLSDIEELGVNWNALSTSGVIDADGTSSSGSGVGIDALTKAPLAGGTGGSFTFFSLNSNFNLEAVVLALQQAKDSRLLASPNVTVIDNEEANIESIEEIPFQELTQTAAGGQIGTTSFKEAGIKLRVVPKIAFDGTIEMTVEPEFSRLTGFTPGSNQPIVDTRRATTRVRVANKQTFMIAGLRQRNDVGNFNGIPVLKDVRFLGNLFRAKDTQIEESELVVFLTPEIVGYHGPLRGRDQLSADTIRCRLDRIPTAEGCPPGCGEFSAGDSGCTACEAGSLSEDSVQYPVEIPTPMPIETPIETLEAAPSEPKEEVLPQPVPAEPQTGDHKYPPLTVALPRRLPKISDGPDGQEISDAKLAREAQGSSLLNPEPMRKGYDTRFRATGSLSDQPQEVAQRPEPPTEKKSWVDRILRR